jgi:polysaccharide deacetylase family protein (PEP-CTERM system associated)
VVENTRRALGILEACGAQATFFIVGWVARKYPALVREIQAHGHELACHSFWHRPVYRLSPQEFEEDTKAARDAIEQAAGTRVMGYRAPSWSITKQCLWALDKLAEEGFAYDSSIFPVHHDLYGIPGAQRFPYTHSGKAAGLREFPPTTVRIAAGGGYLRIFPFAYTNWAMRHIEKRFGKPVVVYFHPWELDTDQPRISCKLRSRLRHYTNLRLMEGRLRSLLQGYPFQSFQSLLNDGKTEAAGDGGDQPPSRGAGKRP